MKNPRVEAGITAEDLVFRTHDDALVLATGNSMPGAPQRFYYPRAHERLRAGWVHAWVPNPQTDWGKWEPIADMRFNDEEQIEEAMRNMARLGLDTGPLGL